MIVKMGAIKCHIDVIENIFDIDTFWLIVLDAKLILDHFCLFIMLIIVNMLKIKCFEFIIDYVCDICLLMR